MKRKLLTYSGITLEYLIQGSGNDVILCFPGFGRPAKEFFDHITPNEQQTLIAINHVYVGGSFVENDQMLSKEDFSNTINQILETEKASRDSIQIVAYSMGGRLALCYLEHEPHEIKHMTLLAPDGLFINGWQRLTGKKIGRFIFRQVILKRHKFFFGFVKAMRRLRLIPEHLPKFLIYHLDTPEKRNLVYKVWSTTAKLIPNHEKIKKTHHCSFKLILGKYDKTIPLSVGNIFKKKISDELEIIEVDSGHDLMKEEVFENHV